MNERLGNPKTDENFRRFIALKKEWGELYDKTLANDDSYKECDFESLCVGWCLAKGLTTDEAFGFYQSMIATGKF